MALLDHGAMAAHLYLTPNLPLSLVLHLWRKYGRKDDSLEFTLKSSGCRIDIFFMYEGVDPPENKAIPTGKDVRYNWFGLQTFNNYQKVG